MCENDEVLISREVLNFEQFILEQGIFVVCGKLLYECWFQRQTHQATTGLKFDWLKRNSTKPEKHEDKHVVILKQKHIILKICIL